MSLLQCHMDVLVLLRQKFRQLFLDSIQPSINWVVLKIVPPYSPSPPPNFDLGWPIVVICMDETMQILKNVGVDGLTRAVSNCNCHKKALFKKGLDSTKKKSPCKTIFYTTLLTCPPFLRAIFKKVFCQILQFGLLQLLNLDLLNFNAHVEQYKLFTIFVDIIDHKFKIVN